jgi:hypothetical protein
MKRQALILAAVLLTLFAGKVVADDLTGFFSAGGQVPIVIPAGVPLEITPLGGSGQPQANITSVQANVPNTATPVILVAPSTVIDVWVSANAAPLHVDWTNTGATTSNAAIQPGTSYRFSARNDAGITGFSVIGDSAAGTFNVVAN